MPLKNTIIKNLKMEVKNVEALIKSSKRQIKKRKLHYANVFYAVTDLTGRIVDNCVKF